MIELTKRRAIAFAVVATLIGIVSVIGFRVFILGSSDDCPPLGNGGAMAIDETGEAVETEEEARTLLRSEIGEEKNASVTGHLYGKDQIHRHVDRVDHYRFSSRPDDGSSIVGWVVTADGTIYQVVQGAC